jgi:citrate synthase
MATLKQRLAEIIPDLRKEAAEINAQHGEDGVGKVTIGQVYGGMRGIVAMLCDTSYVDPDKGLIIRGYPIGQIAHRLPREIFYLLLTGEFPDAEGNQSLEDDFSRYAEVPSYVADVLRAMPRDSHPMVMLSCGVLAMQRESIFAKRYHEGMKKADYWDPMYEDSIRLLARVTGVAAFIYRLRYAKGDLIPPKPGIDWAGNFAHMLGIPDPTGHFADLMRLYMTLHSDHEGGNVSANTCHTVGSALSDAYYAVTAGWNGLAGPLHGLANQECLGFVLEVREKYKGIPTEEQLRQYCWDTLQGGKVIPGYGHAVLRTTDPRFTAFREFGNRVMPEDELFAIVDRLYEIVPNVLRQQGKAKSPWPNVDAISGALLYHFGLVEFDYYTVLFAVSRALGLTAQLIFNRALGTPITRPKSVTTEWIKQKIAEGAAKPATQPVAAK